MKRIRQEPGQTRQRLVLYVEDYADNFEVAELHLGRRYRLLWAPDDKTACDHLRKHAHELTAVLMDIQLKGSQLDGIQLARIIRGTLTEPKLPSYAQDVPPTGVPIFFLTAYGSIYSEKELLESGGTRVLAKPVDFVDLTLALARVHL